MTSDSRIPYLPEPIQGLADIAMNLSWSWNRQARALFKAVDPTLWARTRHNPIAMLREVDPARLAARARDPEFLRLLRSVESALDEQASRAGTWFDAAYPDVNGGCVAYFCAEFAFHSSVPIYSGGLGVLAGDHCKSASDLGVPLVGVGLLYSRGYFDQALNSEGWQEDADEIFNPELTPLVPLQNGDGGRSLATVVAADRTVHVGAWRMQVGRVPVYLLETDLDENAPEDRELTHKLYGGGQERRLKQEWILGVAGVRVLRTLGVDPGAWHANEGHAAFMMVERVRELVDEGSTLEDAVRAVRARSIFTTHTPVPAGHDTFSVEQIESCVGPVWEKMGIDRDTFMGLGRHPTVDHGTFHMTAAAIRLSQRVNGVSKRHGLETRRIWKGLWPGREADKVPMGHVTNGVHRRTWMSRVPILELLDRNLGKGWEDRLDEPGVWDGVMNIDDAELWRVHVEAKESLFNFIREQARVRWRDQWRDAGHLAAAGPMLNHEVLTIGFARRFATYKRADLLFRDVERLLELVTDPWRPVQVVFAGKAHPADDLGKGVLQKVYSFARDPRFEGRVAFLEDYELHLAHRLLEGVDLWLNLPRVPLEASGTSGMKAALNGVPQLSTLDGWWAEGYTGVNGWAIPLADAGEDHDDADWKELMSLLEREVVPLFYERDERGVPVGWVQRMKHAMWVGGSRFTGERMVRQYTNEYYVPSLRGEAEGDDPPTG